MMLYAKLFILSCFYLFNEVTSSCNDRSACDEPKLLLKSGDDLEVYDTGRGKNLKKVLIFSNDDNNGCCRCEDDYNATPKCKSPLIRCKPGFILLGTKCYYFGTDTITWNEALEKCQCAGTELAHPMNTEEDNLLKTYIRTLYPGRYFYLGGTDTGKEGTWSWAHVNGGLFNYTAWPKDRPDNFGGNQNCLLYWINANWDDIECSTLQGYICQQ